MILLQQESYERSIILGASCKHVCSNITLLIWQQTNDRLTTFTVLMKINAGKRIWGSEGGASYEHKGYEFDWLPVYPFPINTFFTAVSIMVGHNMGGAVLLYWSWGLLLGGDSVILWAWDTLENLAENGSRTFLPCLPNIKANGSGVWFWLGQILRAKDTANVLGATSLTDGLLFVCGKHSLHPRVGGFLWNWVEDEEGWRRMRGGQKGFGWGRVCHNGEARDSRATTLILCHSDQTLCYTVWYQTTLCATTLPLWQLPWVWRIACLPSWLPTPPLRRGIHTNVGDIRWQSCPDPLCTHNHWCCVWHLIMWQAHLYSYLCNLYSMQFYQTINEGCLNLYRTPWLRSTTHLKK